MKIGGAPPAREESPPTSIAAELHAEVLAAVNGASLLTRMALADSLENGTEWLSLPSSVKQLFEDVVAGLGLADE